MLVEAAAQGSRLRGWRGRRCGDAQEVVRPFGLNRRCSYPEVSKHCQRFTLPSGPHGCAARIREWHSRHFSRRSLRRRLLQPRPPQGGSGLCEKPVPYAGGSSSRASRAGPKEDSMKPANIALLIAAVAQLIAALATTILAIRGVP